MLQHYMVSELSLEQCSSNYEHYISERREGMVGTCTGSCREKGNTLYNISVRRLQFDPTIHSSITN